VVINKNKVNANRAAFRYAGKFLSDGLFILYVRIFVCVSALTLCLYMPVLFIHAFAVLFKRVLVSQYALLKNDFYKMRCVLSGRITVLEDKRKNDDPWMFQIIK
jgi:hypothetical protein